MSKKWYQSKAVWGGLIAVLAAVAGYFGYDVGAEDQQALTEGLIAIVGATGGVLAVYGRVKANSSIDK